MPVKFPYVIHVLIAYTLCLVVISGVLYKLLGYVFGKDTTLFNVSFLVCGGSIFTYCIIVSVHSFKWAFKQLHTR